MPNLLGMPGLLGGVGGPLSFKMQMASLQALVQMQPNVGQKPNPGLNLFKNLPNLLGQKRPNVATKGAPPLNLLASISKIKKDNARKLQQDRTVSDESSEKAAKSDKASHLEDLEVKAASTKR